MPFPSYGSPMNMPWGTYFSMPYSCPPWFYNAYMPSLPRYWYRDCITYREPVFHEPPPMHSDRFDKENRSIQKKKYKVTKQVYRVKKDGRLSKNSDLTQRIDKPTVEETSASSVAQIVPNGDYTSNNIVEQCSNSAGGQDKSIYIGSDRTGLTGSSDRSEPGKFGGAKNRIKPTFEELLDKYKKISAQKQSNQLEGKQKRSSSSPRSRKHQQSSYWSSSFIPSMHVPWSAYSGLFNPWFGHNSWLPYYDYQFYTLPRSYDLYNRPHWPSQDFCYWTC